MSEIWDLLDGEGNKTGKQIMRGEKIPEGCYHLAADIWMVNSDKKILIQKRSPQKEKSPNVWAMTGGSSIVGETSLETIEREVKEEIGISLNIHDLILGTKIKTGTVFLDTYFIKQDVDLKDIVMQEEEVCDVKWASLEEIDELVKKEDFIKHRWEFVREPLKEFIGE